MAVNPNEDTEFNDALRAHGILPPLEKPPPSPSPPPSPTFSDILNDFTPSELREISEDAPDDETERMIAAYRQQRIAEERALDKKARFGRVYPIGRDDYTREVTEASKVNEEDDEEEQGTAVVCFLYKDGIPRSDRTFEHIRTLAARYPRTKFVSIVGDKCIPNLPDSRVPMLIVYKKGDIRNQVVAWGADRERRIEELEALLLVTGALHPPERQRPEDRKKDDSDDEDEDDYDRSSRMRSTATSVNGRTRKNVRESGDKKKGNDSDSDFEFDL
ncbi:Proteolipid protein 2 [Stygiomarasmius scandens]|uniref:Proteolipid protein 2 n=1 Tax=Marasmiellus scandens TaxID=2682957 RepID=A0ABR1JK44_9AGAR